MQVQQIHGRFGSGVLRRSYWRHLETMQMLNLVIFGLTHNILSEVREHKMDGHSSPYLRGRRHHVLHLNSREMVSKANTIQNSKYDIMIYYDGYFYNYFSEGSGERLHDFIHEQHKPFSSLSRCDSSCGRRRATRQVAPVALKSSPSRRSHVHTPGVQTNHWRISRNFKKFQDISRYTISIHLPGIS